MLSFLKRLGQAILAGVQVFTGFAPLLESADPKQAGAIATASTDLSALSSLVVQVEAASAALQAAGATVTGPQKLAMLIPLVGQVITSSNVVAGKTIANAQLLQLSIQEYAQATVDLLNAVHPDEAAKMLTTSVKT